MRTIDLNMSLYVALLMALVVTLMWLYELAQYVVDSIKMLPHKKPKVSLVTAVMFVFMWMMFFFVLRHQ